MPKSFPHAGGFNLKGKKSHDCSCGCCTVFNFREDYESRSAVNEMRDASVEDGHQEELNG